MYLGSIAVVMSRMCVYMRVRALARLDMHMGAGAGAGMGLRVPVLAHVRVCASACPWVHACVYVHATACEL